VPVPPVSSAASSPSAPPQGTARPADPDSNGRASQRLPSRGGRLTSLPSRREPVWKRPVVQFAAAVVVASVILVMLSSWLISRAALREAVTEARTSTQQLAKSVMQPALTPAVLAGLERQDPATIRQLNAVVHQRILWTDWLVRVKLWEPSGRIIYSDESRLIGRQFPLEEHEEAVLATGVPDAHLSDLTSPENQFESRAGKLYETYVRVYGPKHQPLLFEAYYSDSGLTRRSNQLLSGFQPLALGGPLLLAILIVPLVWGLTRRLRLARADGQRLLQRALDASDVERRRIARDLHDGVVQELAGASFALSATAEQVGRQPTQTTAASLERVAAGVRHSMRSLRSLLVEIYPPNLHTEGLAAALDDLLSPLPDSGLQTHLTVARGLELPAETSTLLFRVAQEAVRNAQRHADATQLWVDVRATNDRVTLTVADNGKGFDVAESAESGHLGLRLLHDLVDETGGRLSVASSAEGTTVVLEAPR
jgi:two-component system NarL family sensor kinase